ncbi:MAG: alkaline phosphatase family protein [bacterium]|nr:alkaline phosphatase family protein [bacterium]
MPDQAQPRGAAARRQGKKVVVIGLDCAAPQLVFDQWTEDLPNLRSLMNKGIYGPMRSTIPAITCPAWMSMMTSKCPGTLGFYGFRNRADYSYSKMVMCNSTTVKEKTLWDLLGEAGQKSILLGIPQTYPVRPINGCMVSCFLTPDTSCQYTYPKSLKTEIELVTGGYIIDVENFRTNDKERLLEQIYQMTEKRFKAARYLLRQKEWDFFMMVEMGVDRIHHGFWKFTDPQHRQYEPGNPFEQSIKNYYRYIDERIGELLSFLDDETAVLVVSDHGAKKMDGGIAINEWLQREGYLTLAEQPSAPIRFEQAKIDWSKTKCWGEGGYYGRIFLNVQGREPQGVIRPQDYESVRDELKAKLEALADEKGNQIGTRVFKPQEIYPRVNGIAPDLIVYFGNLDWRSVGSVGLSTIHTFENDTGPDDANHAQEGIFILYDPNYQGPKVQNPGYFDILDVAPTVLHLMGIEPPADFEGKLISAYEQQASYC